MKATIILFLVFATKLASYAQITQGQFLLGGGIHFESVKSDGEINPTYKTTDFFINPNIGYFIISKMAVGARVDFSFYKTISGNVETKNRATTIAPFLRYYLLPLQKKVNAFIDVSYVHEKTKWSSLANPGYYEKAKGYYISAGPSIFLTSQLALEFTLGYKRTLSENYDDTVVSKFISGISLQVHVGKIKHAHQKNKNPE